MLKITGMSVVFVLITNKEFILGKFALFTLKPNSLLCDRKFGLIDLTGNKIEIIKLKS